MKMNLWNKFEIWLFKLHESKYRKIDDEYYEVKLTPELVAERFKLLFKLHGVQVTEIPELEEFKDITLYDLSSNDRLLQKLTPKYIEKAANYFKVRIEWLRSGEAVMYSLHNWYKSNAGDFFQKLTDIDFEKTYDPFLILTIHDKFDVHSDEYQPFILVLRKYLCDVGEKEIYQYRLGRVWDWHHSLCRLQAKAIATRYYQLTERMITLCKTDKETFHKVKQGYIPPILENTNHMMSFEEYGALEFSHLDEPYEAFEYKEVLKTIKDYHLDEIDMKIQPYTDDEFKSAPQETENLHRKAAIARYEPVYQLKHDCIYYWLETEKRFSYKNAAKRFCAQLSEDNKTLTKSGRIDTLSEAISEYERRHELEAKGKLPKWLESFNPEG
jgi:hypothetical protein